MTFTCGSCSQVQKLTGFHIELDIEESHRIWGASCSECGFAGKSRVSPQVWSLLQTAQRLEREQTPLINFAEPNAQSISRIEELVKQVGNVISNRLEAALRN